MTFQVGKAVGGHSLAVDSKDKVERVFAPTAEQVAAKDLVLANNTSAIHAVSGSGKTSEFVYISTFLKEPSLYMTFNVTMAKEAAAKFGDHVTCMTTHSLAYLNVGKSYQHKLTRPHGRYVNVALTPAEVARYYRLPGFPIQDAEDISSNMLGLIIKDTVSGFEVGDAFSITAETIPYAHIKSLKSKYPLGFDLHKFNKVVVKYANLLWEERIDKFSEVCCTHNTYLKLYQLSEPDLSTLYKVIYLDEAQDLNPVTRSIILMQQDKCKLIFTGDRFQQIYSWNGSVNAIQSLKCPKISLSKSFRFGPRVAQLAQFILKGEAKVVGFEKMDTDVGLSVVDLNKPYTMIFRTNMALIFAAAKLIKKGESVNVNIDMKDFVALLKSTTALYSGDMKQVKHQDIIPYSNWEELLEESKGGGELNRLVKIVSGGDAESTIALLHSHANEKSALISMTTAHKSKGLEFEQVVLANDFPSNYNKNGTFIGLREEDTNLLYVAATRAMGALDINKTCQEFYDINGCKFGSEEVIASEVDTDIIEEKPELVRFGVD
jgi:superfamily I DNA/RNA helicase